MHAMRLPTNHIALPMTLYPYPQNPVARVLSCVVVAHSFSRYLSIVKGYTASKTSRLYSFQPKCILLRYCDCMSEQKSDMFAHKLKFILLPQLIATLIN